MLVFSQRIALCFHNIQKSGLTPLPKPGLEFVEVTDTETSPLKCSSRKLSSYKVGSERTPEPIVWKGVFFLDGIAARVRVPGSSPFSQLNLHETGETKVVWMIKNRTRSKVASWKRSTPATSSWFACTSSWSAHLPGCSNFIQQASTMLSSSTGSFDMKVKIWEP